MVLIAWHAARSDTLALKEEEEEVPGESVRVRPVPSLLRAADARYVRWIARRVGVGRGERSSELAFDGVIKARA